MEAFCFHTVVTKAGRCLESRAVRRSDCCQGDFRGQRRFYQDQMTFSHRENITEDFSCQKNGSTAVQTDFSSTMPHTSQLAKVRKRCRGASSCSFASQPAIKQKKQKKELALSDLSDGSVRPLTFPVLLRFSAASFWIRVI